MRVWGLAALSGLLFLFGGCKKDEPIPTSFERPLTSDIVMYEINTPRFTITHDLQGVTDRLDEIRALGINTIWLMPIYPVGVANSFGSPYCVKDYKAVNPSLGTMDDLKTLVEEAHTRNIAVILDWVANHTAWDHAWISNEGWYSQDASGNIISPPNTTWTDVADLNFENADMRLAMIDAMQFWVEEAGVDGFRCDAADYVPYDFWVQALDSLYRAGGSDLIMLAEGTRSDHFTAGFRMNYAWSFLSSIKNVFTNNGSAASLFTMNEMEYGAVPGDGRKLRFITNHDESNNATPVTVFGSREAALAASVITYCLDGVPLIYCGQEVGVSSTSVYTGTGSINWEVSPELLAGYQSLLNFYSGSDALKRGEPETFAHADISIFKKTYNDTEVLVMVNTRPTEITFDVPVSLQGNWKDAFADDILHSLGNDYTLPANGYLIVKRD